MLVAIHRHKLLVEGNAPKPLFNTEFHSVATRSANAFLSVPSAPFRSIGVRESLTPFANRVRPKIEPPSKDGVAKYPHGFSFPRRLRRSQRCWEYPSKHRRDRCERRALLAGRNTSQPRLAVTCPTKQWIVMRSILWFRGLFRFGLSWVTVTRGKDE